MGKVIKIVLFIFLNILNIKSIFSFDYRTVSAGLSLMKDKQKNKKITKQYNNYLKTYKKLDDNYGLKYLLESSIITLAGVSITFPSLYGYIQLLKMISQTDHNGSAIMFRPDFIF